jgi:hypothetical protein
VVEGGGVDVDLRVARLGHGHTMPMCQVSVRPHDPPGAIPERGFTGGESRLRIEGIRLTLVDWTRCQPVDLPNGG